MMQIFADRFFSIVSACLPYTRGMAIRGALLRLRNVQIAKNAAFCGGGKILGRGKLVIGKGSWISPFSKFYTHLDAAIIIGNGCAIGPEVSFITGGHEIGAASKRAGKGTASPIAIEDGCWIGARSTILGGVTIGRASIVAAGALVASDVAPNTLVGGVPARKIRDLSTASENR